MQDAGAGEGGVLHTLPLHGSRRLELVQPGLPHLHRLPARPEGAHVRAAGPACDVHHRGESRDRRL